MASDIEAPALLPEPLRARWQLLHARRLELDIWARESAERGNEDTVYGWKLNTVIPLTRRLLKLSGLWERGRRNAHTLHLRRLDWVHPRLPQPLDGVTILHLSDLHFARREPEFPKAVEWLLGGIEVDLCVLTGDYRYGHVGDLQHVRTGLLRTLGAFRAREGVYAVWGNHDTLAMRPFLEEAGAQLLVNESCCVWLNGHPLYLVGVDEPHVIRAADFPLAMHGVPRDAFVLGLVHSPEVIPEAQAAGVDLYLCGHTHGGQIRLPLWGAVESNAKCPPEYRLGRWEYCGMQGLTTAGLGVTDLPVRFNCPAEAHLITLRAPKK